MRILLTAALVLAAACEAGARGGAVTRCDLTGINPARHGAIFKHPEVARSYGFVKGPDGTWQVDPKLCGGAH
jgi:hypothetical protein